MSAYRARAVFQSTRKMASSPSVGTGEYASRHGTPPEADTTKVFVMPGQKSTKKFVTSSIFAQKEVSRMHENGNCSRDGRRRATLTLFAAYSGEGRRFVCAAAYSASSARLSISSGRPWDRRASRRWPPWGRTRRAEFFRASPPTPWSVLPFSLQRNTRAASTRRRACRAGGRTGAFIAGRQG